MKKASSKLPLLLAAGVLVIGAGGFILARREPAPSREAEAVLARLEADEAAVRTARLSITMEQRDASLPERADSEEAWRRAREGAIQARRLEDLLFSGGDWRREVIPMDVLGAVRGRLLVGIQDGQGRVLEEQGSGASAQRQGGYGQDLGMDPLLALFAGRSAPLLADVRWTGVRKTPEQVVLTGTSPVGEMEVTLRTSPRYLVERVIRTSVREGPNAKVTQKEEMVVRYQDGKDGPEPRAVEQLATIGSPVNRAVLTTLEARKAEFNVPIPEDQLAIRFPPNTTILDERFDPPLKYVRKDRDLTDAELEVLKKQRRFVARPDRPAPGWQLKTLDGQASRLEDYLGKVVVLTWFASW